MLQATSDGKAIWRATVTSATGWSHSFTLLRLTPALIWDATERPAPFSGTIQVDTVTATAPQIETAAEFAAGSGAGMPAPTAPAQSITATADGVDVLLGLLGTDMQPITESFGSAPAALTGDATPQIVVSEQKVTVPIKAQVSGEHFMSWLKRAIQSRKLIINDARALVHTVDGTAFLVSPGLFQRYAQEHPQVASLAGLENVADWQWVQKEFERLHLHRKQASGLNIWTCDVTGPRKARRLHGYLLNAPSGLFEELPPDNPYLSVQVRS